MEATLFLEKKWIEVILSTLNPAYEILFYLDAVRTSLVAERILTQNFNNIQYSQTTTITLETMTYICIFTVSQKDYISNLHNLNWKLKVSPLYWKGN